MKKLFLILILLFTLTGCKKKVEVFCEEGISSQVYAINNKNNQTELVYIEYDIQDEVDIFNLYTCYQNQLPLGYHSSGMANITLISSSVVNQVVYYEVDFFISLVALEEFHSLLTKTAALYDYSEIHIILDKQQLI